MKKSLLILFTLNLLVLVSAADFSLGEVFDTLGEENIALGLIFFITFAILNVALNRGNLKNTSSVGQLSFFGAIGLTALAYFSGLDLENMFSIIGLTYDVLTPIVSILAIVFLVYAIYRWRGNSLLIIGVFLFLAGVTGIVYEQSLVSMIGLIILVIWGIMKFLKSRKPKQYNQSSGYGQPQHPMRY